MSFVCFLCSAANQTIRESLDLLNQDFAAYSSGTEPRFLDIPVFDRTPAVEKVNTGSPVYDFTPLRQVLESETVEATPVMEETQSQSMVGTQVVRIIWLKTSLQRKMRDKLLN